MKPELAAYIYPWDLARGGAGAVLDELGELGFTQLNLTANYHAISSLSPRGEDTRLFMVPRGGVFFPARAERYGRVRPVVWPEREITDAWAVGAATAVERGFAVNAWTIGMFQPWMAQDYPYTARVFFTGDRADTGICPNSPDVQEYYAAFAADLADQIPVRRFILEGYGIPDWNYGWVRPRVLADVSPVGRAMLRLCFCGSCSALAADVGLDTERVHRTAKKVFGQYGFRNGTAGPSADEVLAGDPELLAYSLLGSAGATRVVREMAAALRRGGNASGLLVPVDGPEPDANAPDLAAVRDVVSGINVWTAVMPADRQRSYLPRLRESAPELELSLVIGPPLAAGSAVTLVTPSFNYSDPVFLDRIETARQLNPTEIAVYHYGLLDQAAFRRTVDCITQS